jgi:hypothetical protein
LIRKEKEERKLWLENMRAIRQDDARAYACPSCRDQIEARREERQG